MRAGCKTLGVAVFGFPAWALALSGCSVLASTPVATPRPTATATATPVPTVAFVVGVGTPPPTPRRTPPTPTPTRFTPPSGPYIALSASSGPVEGRNLAVRGGNLPPSQQVSLVWTPRRAGAGIATTTYTNKSGGFLQRFSAPPAPPGTYQVQAQVAGVTYASAAYRVVSSARVAIAVVPSGGGDVFQVQGSRFVPRERLLLAAYPLTRRARPVILGRTRAGGSGDLSFSVTRRMRTGEYVLHVFSTEGLSADLASTYFQVQV